MVCSALVGIGKCALPFLEEPVGYLMHFNDNVKDLKDRVPDLVARKEHVNRLVITGRSNGEEENPEVSEWRSQAAEMIQKAAEIQEKVAENKGCLHCLNLKWRYSISKQAKQMTERIVRHYDAGNPEKMKMTMRPSLRTVIKEEAPSIQGLPSVESSLQEVMNALRDENTKIIGVWGMGGVGKTTLVKNVNNKLDGTRQFKKVIMVTVSKDVDTKKIQGDIAKRLGLTLTESSRASDLRSRLMEEETFLIILDDLWEPLVLAEVGIPSPTSHTGCKIIFTTRRKNVCNGMESKVNVLVNVLSEKEPEKLFKEKAGDVVDDPSLHTKAMEVLKECAGLPLAITALGRALKDEKNPRVWEDALSQMRMAAPRDIEGMEKAVYQSIKISYDRLQNELKPLFLFCCLFPEDYDIHVDQMIHMWKGEGFLDDHESLEEAINRGHTWVGKLISSCLLLESSEEGHVKMHDIVRDVGIWISSNECEDYKSFVGIPQKGLSHGKNWEEYKRISLWCCEINKLPEGMHCPRLLTLMMPENYKLTEIQGWFWEVTKDLRVLDLSSTAISKIPLSNLVNLRVLCLRSCKFEEGNCLSALGGLKQLQFLDLSFNYRLRELPNEIGELVNLRSLDLTDTDNLKIVPSGVISRLTLLEELKMWNSFHEWKAEGKDASSSICNVSLSEVACLKELSNLHLCIVEVERLPRDYPLFKHPTKLKKFCLCICPRPRKGVLNISYPESNPDELRYMEIDRCRLIPEWALRLLPQTTHLKLIHCKGQEALNRGGGFSSLKSLTVNGCDDVEFVVSAKESPENAFGNLQSLELNYLPNLKKVVTKYEEGLLPTHLLHNLKELTVEECPELKHLLPSVLLQGMDNLTDVSVSDCEGMEHLFDRPPTVELRNDVLSKLRSLRLSFLPSMTSIWPMGLVVKLENLATLYVRSCHGLKKSVVSAMQMKGGLPNLVELTVDVCRGVEEIISDVVDNEGLLPKLENLTLSSLPELVRIYGGGEAVPPPQLDWHSLKKIDVDGRPKLKKVQPLQGGADSVVDLSRTAISKIPLSNLVNLRVLCLRRCKFEEGNCLSALGGLKQLQFLDLSFNDWLCELPNEIGELVNLRSLDLTNTINLKIVLSGVISRLTLLEELKMWNSFQEWKVEEDASSSSSSNAYLSEVASLKELSNLHLCIVEVERFPQDYPLIKHPTKLKKFRFRICQRPDDGVVDYMYPYELKYMELVGYSFIPEWALMLLPETTHLNLINCKGQETLNRCGGFPSLKSLTVRKCDDVEFVVSAKESPENAFGNLQTLRLRELPNLKKVVTKYEEGLLPTLIFHNLEKMEVEKCPELKHLLPSVLLQGMDNLTDVSVTCCEGMEHLFDGPPTVEQRNDVPSKLRYLGLYSLPSMTSIWPMGLVVSLQKLAFLAVWRCDGLKKSVVSAMQMNGGLPNLDSLTVEYCGGVEEIISDVVDHEGLLPKLKKLILSSLPELVRIYGGGEAVPPPQLDWHSLKRIEVQECHKLKKVQPLQGGVDSVPSLKEIKGERNWWEGLDWEGDDIVISQFHALFKEVLTDDED